MKSDNNNPILSICIPTYNRSFLLKDCLRDLTDQLINDPKTLNNTEIVISDNDSKDDTKKIVLEYQKRCKNIKYFKNEKNVGFDLNVVNSIKKACGKYCMYLGDDDAIAIGGIRFIFNYLKNNDISVLTYDNKDYSFLKESQIKDGNIVNNLIYSTMSHNNFYEKGYSTGTFSLFTFNRDSWLKAVDVKNNVGWLYYDVIIKMSSLGIKPLIHISYPLVYLKQNCLWNKNGGEIFAFLTYKKLLEKWQTYNYNKNIFNNELTPMPKKLIIILLRAKGNDLKISLDNYKQIYKAFYKNYFYMLIATIIFFIPNKIIKIVRDLNKKVTKIKT